MTITMYDLAGAEAERRFSPFCWRAKMALAHKGLAVETVPWRLTEKVAELLGGADNICVSTDFPHFDSSFPDVSKRVLTNPSITPDLAAKILYGGARLYGFGEDDFAKADAAAKRRDNQAARA